jgi:hypothetical protein
MREKNNYIDNKRFTASLIQYRIEKEANPEITLRSFSDSEYLGKGIMQICYNLARKANFCNYTFKEEFILDAIENCLRAALNFDPSLSSNAFGYFTKVAFNAFIRRIQKEQKKREQLLRLMSDSATLNDIIQAQFDGSEQAEDAQAFIDQMQSFLLVNEKLIDVVDIPRSPRKKKVVFSPLDEFLEVESI